MKRVVLSVTEIALPSPMRGSIDSYSGFGRGAEVGQEIHELVQERRKRENPNYEAEVSISNLFEAGGFHFEICGRIDGLFKQKSIRTPDKIEEIKSSFNISELIKRLKESQGEHPYLLQVKTYGYMYWIQNKKWPVLTLHLVSSRDGDTVDFEVEFDQSHYESWMERRLKELVIDAKLAEKRAKRRRKAGEALVFPFDQPRAGQVDLIDTIAKGMEEKRRMLIQAPTGLGKTIGVLYPSLREALNRGQKVVYVTPKNSQHVVAEDAIERLNQRGANLRAMTITAKSKMCFKNEPICNPDFCEFAKDHYTKVHDNKLIEKMSKKRSLTAKVFKNVAREYEICPFELQIDSTLDADAVICDYNYVFAPRTGFGGLISKGLDQDGQPNLVIDEAHNLPSRAMDYYSPTLSTHVLERLREDVERLPRRFRSDMNQMINDCIGVIKSCEPKGAQTSAVIRPPMERFLEQDGELRNYLSTYLKSDTDIQPGDAVLKLSFYWSQFTDALEFIASGRQEFFTTYNANPPTIRITCCDASEMLKESYNNFEQVVAFSATLKPFEYYQQLSGLHGSKRELKIAEFVSPFPKENRKIVLIPQISSKYSDREKSAPRIAETISRIVQLKPGNYFAFFPSFDFMERVAAQFQIPTGFEVIKQARRMHADEIAHTLDRLRSRAAAHIVFAVQGGVFSEGVDYPGEMVIGAFIIGPPLPSFDLERERMREYYETHFHSGFDYAYTFPAMAKAVQAAGRVIRSERDHGLIVLIDNRFLQKSYTQSMPEDWFSENVQELVSTQILKDIQDHWQRLMRSDSVKETSPREIESGENLT